jgi:LuxR family transcriptional regulator, maltose regulon positive regulatory protein
MERLPSPRPAPDGGRASDSVAAAHDVAALDGVPLLTAKLAPPEQAHATVPRPRLLGRLTRAVSHSPLTLLSGPAGSGKTVLADSWRRAQNGGRSIAWLSLDAYDDDPATFWTYVVEALTGAGVRFTGLPQLVPGEAPPPWFVRQVGAQLTSGGRQVVLIVDDAYHLTDRTIITGLDLLIRNAGRGLRLVLCGRADPPLPLHQYRLADSMSEIRSAELAFTAEETRELLAAMKVPVTADVAAALCTETNGWAVGLRLAAAPLAQGVPPQRLVTSLAHDDGSVAQYLVAEVLSVQPASVRRLLMRISVTAELWPDLVDRLGRRRDTRRVLSALAHANAFVEEAPGAPGGFRIHPLFREMLQAQLAFSHPAELAAAHRSCASWYADAGRTAEAIRHAAAAQDGPLVTRLLVDDLVVPRLLAHGSDPAVAVLGSLPPGSPGAGAACLRAAAALATGGAAAPDDLRAAAEVDGAGGPAVRMSAALLLLFAGAGSDDAGTTHERADAATALLEAVPAEQRRGRRDVEALIAHARALAAVQGQGSTAHVLATLRASAAAAQVAGARRLRGRALAMAALVRAIRGELRLADELDTEAESLSAEEERADSGGWPAAAIAKAWVHQERYALTDTRDWVARARGRQPPGVSPVEEAVTGASLAVLQSRQLRLRHEHDAATAVVGPHLDRPGLPGWVHGEVVAEAVRLGLDDEALLADPSLDPVRRDRLRATAALLRDEPRPAALPPLDDRDPGSAVESRVVRTCLMLANGSVGGAADELERALGRARPELLRWPFFDAPAQVRWLLRSQLRLQASAAWLSPSATPGARAAGPAVPPEAVVQQELSEREREVLEHLSQMLSTAEIAAVMFISVNTVRTHIRSILRKLGVSRRNQAVRRAREAGLLRTLN